VVEMPTESEPVRVVQGDCLEVLRTLPDGCVDAVITDPPYGIDLGNHGNFSRDWTIAGDHDCEAAAAISRWAESRKVPLCMFGSAYQPYPGRWRNILVWDKGPAVGAGGDTRTCWKRTFDLIYVRGNRPLREKRDAAVLKFWQSPNYRGDFAHHPAQKPVELIRYLIRQLTDPGDIILDPFAGSGTTGVAAIAEGRRAILIEKEPKYADIARRRVREAMGTGLLAGVG